MKHSRTGNEYGDELSGFYRHYCQSLAMNLNSITGLEWMRHNQVTNCPVTVRDLDVSFIKSLKKGEYGLVTDVLYQTVCDHRLPQDASELLLEFQRAL